MDVFVENIVSLKRSKATKLMQSGIILGSALVAVIATMFISQTQYAYLFVAVCVVCLFLGWKLSSMFNIEYEYYLNNGVFDIEKITNERKRKKLMTVQCSKITSFKKYNQGENQKAYAIEVHAGNLNAPNAYCFTCNPAGEGEMLVIFQPNEEMLNSMLKFIPRRVVDKDVLGRD